MMVSLFYCGPATVQVLLAVLLSCSVQRNQRFCTWWMDGWLLLMNYEMAHSGAFQATATDVVAGLQWHGHLMRWGPTTGGDRPSTIGSLANSDDWLADHPSSRTETHLSFTWGTVAVCSVAGWLRECYCSWADSSGLTTYLPGALVGWMTGQEQQVNWNNKWMSEFHCVSLLNVLN